VLLVEDIATTGGQVLEAAKLITEIGARVQRIVAVIDGMRPAAELGFLFMNKEFGLGEESVVAAVIIVEMGIDDDIDILRDEVFGDQTIDDRFRHQAGFFLEAAGNDQFILVQAGIDKNVLASSLEQK